MKTIEYKISLSECMVIGSAGFGTVIGEVAQIEFTNQSIYVIGSDQIKIELALPEVADISISGPGTVTTGSVFGGGGFGVSGSLEGIGIASILNALTTKTKTHTFIGLITNVGELHFHYSGLEPGALRMELAPVFSSLRAINPVWINECNAVLHRLFATNAIDEIEFKRLQSRLLVGHTLGDGPRMGRCPSCDERLPVTALECPKCHANFGKGAAWRVIPST